MVADGLHHGLVDLALDELHGWLRVNEAAFTEMLIASGRPGGRRRGSTRRSPTGSTSRSCAGSRTSAPTRTTTRARALDSMLGPARAGPAGRPRDARADRAAQGAAARPPAGADRRRSSLWNALRRALHRLAARTPRARCRARLQTEVSAFGDRLREDPALRERLDGVAADVAVFAVDRYGAELPPSSPTPSSAGTARRPRGGSSCTSGATCSSSGSTARSSAAWSAW